MPKPETLATPEETRVYNFSIATFELSKVTALTVSRTDGSHYLETADGIKHIITINGLPCHIEFKAGAWSK